MEFYLYILADNGFVLCKSGLGDSSQKPRPFAGAFDVGCDEKLAAHVAVHEVLNADAVTPAKRLLICAAVAAGNVRMPVLIAVIYIRTTVVPIVLAGAFNAVAEAALLNRLPILRWRGFPWLPRSISRRRRALCGERCRRERQCRDCHNSQYNVSKFHSFSFSVCECSPTSCGWMHPGHSLLFEKTREDRMTTEVY